MLYRLRVSVQRRLSFLLQFCCKLFESVLVVKDRIASVVTYKRDKPFSFRCFGVVYHPPTDKFILHLVFRREQSPQWDVEVFRIPFKCRITWTVNLHPKSCDGDANHIAEFCLFKSFRLNKTFYYFACSHNELLARHAVSAAFNC